MADHKQLGAKQMFDQAIIYLFNSYREAGLSKDEAQRHVAEDIEKVRKKYADLGMVPSTGVSFSDPKVLLSQLIKEAETFNINPVVKKDHLNKLNHLRRIIN